MSHPRFDPACPESLEGFKRKEGRLLQQKSGPNDPLLANYCESGLIHLEVPGILSVCAEILVARDGIRVLGGRSIFVGAGIKVYRAAGAGRDGNKARFGSPKAQKNGFGGVIPDGDQWFENNLTRGRIARAGSWF